MLIEEAIGLPLLRSWDEQLFAAHQRRILNGVALNITPECRADLEALLAPGERTMMVRTYGDIDPLVVRLVLDHVDGSAFVLDLKDDLDGLSQYYIRKVHVFDHQISHEWN